MIARSRRVNRVRSSATASTDVARYLVSVVVESSNWNAFNGLARCRVTGTA